MSGRPDIREFLHTIHSEDIDQWIEFVGRTVELVIGLIEDRKKMHSPEEFEKWLAR